MHSNSYMETFLENDMNDEWITLQWEDKLILFDTIVFISVSVLKRNACTAWGCSVFSVCNTSD